MKKLIFLLPLLLLFTGAKGQIYYVQSLKQKLATARKDTAQVNTLIDLARAYYFSYPDTAESYARQGLQLAKKISYKYGEAACFIDLCLALTHSGNYVSALEYGLKALPIFENLRDTTSIVYTHIRIMNCYGALEDYDQALQYGYRAKSLLRLSRPRLSKTDTYQISIAFMHLSMMHKEKSRFDSALYYGQKAHEWAKHLPTYTNMGEVYAAMGRNDSALSYYRKGFPLVAGQSNKVVIIRLYNGMSKVFESLDRTDSAIYYANKGIHQAGVGAIPLRLLQTSLQVSHLYELQGKQDSAVKYLKLAHTLKDSLYSRKKTRDAQSIAFNEKMLQQELAAQKQQDENRTRTAVLLGVVLLILLIVFFLLRNNRQKQKANVLLQRQKAETEQQKAKAETALAELKAAQAQLVQKEKMASLGELTAGIAHEIQNPLNFVNNFSEVNKELISEMKKELLAGNTQEAISIADDIEENEEKINDHGKRADAIVKGMMQHSGTSTGQKEPTDINSLADEYLRLSYHGFRAKDKDFNAKFTTDFDESVGRTEVVPQDIGRALLNLYNNAFYSLNEKKKQLNGTFEPIVSVTTKRSLPTTVEGRGEVIISVKDNGTGIPGKVLDKIYQPFFTTKPTGQGTGLGLSLSYDIIKAHGGELKVKTEEGEGANFIIHLPIR